MPNNPDQPFALITTGFLNTVNDTVVGGTQDLTNAAHYAGVLGARRWLGPQANGEGATFSSGNTAYGGCYQYVLFYASATASPAAGLPVFWASDVVSTAFEGYVVTTDSTAARCGRIAGVCLPTPSVTKGNYGWIQTKGKALVKFKSSITGSPVADGDLIIVDSGTGLADDLTQSGNPTFAQLKAVIGTAIGIPTANTTNLVLLRSLPDVI